MASAKVITGKKSYCNLTSCTPLLTWKLGLTTKELGAVHYLEFGGGRGQNFSKLTDQLTDRSKKFADIGEWGVKN